MRWFDSSRRSTSGLISCAVLLMAGTTWAVAPTTVSLNEGRDLDARLEYNKSFALEQPAAHVAAVEQLSDTVPDLTAVFDTRFGTVRTLSSHTSYLTGPNPGAPLDVALAYVRANLAVLGLSPADIAEFEVTDSVVSKQGGATHIYLRQLFQGVPVLNGQLHINVNRDGRILSLNNLFVPNLAAAAQGLAPSLSAADALGVVAAHLGSSFAAEPTVLSVEDGAQRVTQLDGAGISLEPVTARLMYLPIRAGQVALVWNLVVRTADRDHQYGYTVDARSGEVWTRHDYVLSETFQVYPQPLDAPTKTRPLPPLDGRTLAVNPENALASPNGWFQDASRLTVGNNVNACGDTDDDDTCDAGQPSCPSGICSFPIDLTRAPAASLPAAITNLFYWNNILHDIQYQYGFDEVAGNFQTDNFGRGGIGGDPVDADAQDGGGNCNANFNPPPDGERARMQMYTCTMANPARDGDFDNGVIVHEYAHGISIRQVGGPSNSDCLNNAQQAGEGWSDWLALVYTARKGDFAKQVRGEGSYLFNRDPSGTIRNLPYSTNDAVNPWTYESIAGASIPHGVGSRWTQGLWEVYWALTEKWGFEEDLVNFDITDRREAGNKRALFYVNEGFKNTACNPTFIDNRNAILQAALDNFGGEDVCTIWQAFANFGLGTDAATNGPGATTARNGFRVPRQCALGAPQAPLCRNVRYNASFEEGAEEGWTASASSTCSAGNFVSGTPLEVTSSGVVTQPSGAASGDSAFFTAANGGPGVGDVDGGTCEVRSPLIDLGPGDVTIATSYFHGQRTTGDDAADGFTLDLLDESGNVLRTLVSQGDNRSQASWADASSQFLFQGGSVQLRARASDGVARDDLIEAGIDDVLVCGNLPRNDSGCAMFEDFEGGTAPGWFNDGASTCTTGAFVVGVPSSGGGVQIAASNQGLRSAYTAENVSAGIDDVDGGVCIYRSPGADVAVDSTLSVAYWHGQGATADPDGADFFALEYSIDGGATWQTLASAGDGAATAAWATATAAVPAGSNVALRVQCSDGATVGDLVECGIDDVSVCANPN
jgi:extracellular elastinolytic metalloproteinase